MSGIIPELNEILHRISKGEFCERFVAHMCGQAGFDQFDDGRSVKEYAEETAPTYFEDPNQRRDGPEACAESDMSYWGED